MTDRMWDSFRIERGVLGGKWKIPCYGCYAENCDSNQVGLTFWLWWDGRIEAKIVAGCILIENVYVGMTVFITLLFLSTQVSMELPSRWKQGYALLQ